MYGKIIDRQLVIAPNPIIVDEYKIYNPKPEEYAAEGYIEVIESEPPAEANKHYEKSYAERNGKIYGEWVEAEAPKHAPALEERVSAIEAQITDTELALCELYEVLCNTDAKEDK